MAVEPARIESPRVVYESQSHASFMGRVVLSAYRVFIRLASDFDMDFGWSVSLRSLSFAERVKGIPSRIIPWSGNSGAASSILQFVIHLHDRCAVLNDAGVGSAICR